MPGHGRVARFDGCSGRQIPLHDNRTTGGDRFLPRNYSFLYNWSRPQCQSR